MKQLKYIVVAVTLLMSFAFGLNAAEAPKTDTGLIGKSYVLAVANVTDIRSNLTANNIYGATLGANIAAFSNVDVGGTFQLQRLADNKIDLNNFNSSANVTVYTKLGALKPYVRGTAGWVIARQNTHKFQAFNYSGSVGTELQALKNVTLGGDVTLTNIQKARAGGTGHEYRGYVVFWANNHIGLTGSYTYVTSVNSAGVSLGSVLRF